MSDIAQQLITFFSRPDNYFTVATAILVLGGIVIYDIIWTWVVKDATSTWWFGRPQAMLKIGSYLYVFGVLAIFVFVPWWYNLGIVVILVLATVAIVRWLKKTNRIH